MHLLLISKKQPMPNSYRIAQITADDPKYANKFIWLCHDGDQFSKNDPKSSELIFNPNSKVEIFPFFDKIKNEKQVYHTLVTGQTGSGKSYVIGQCLEQMMKTLLPPLTEEEELYREQDDLEIAASNIVIFSGSPSDAALDIVRNGRTPIRMDLKHENLQDIELSDLKNSIVIFDDIERISFSKKVRDYLVRLRDDMLENGRHYNINMFTVSHNPLGGPLTRVVNSETGYCFIFPRHNAGKRLSDYLDRYVDLTQQQIDRIKELPSRWVFIRRRFPRYVVYQHGAYLL